MIFVTVGSQLPFDRLIRAMDEWAGRNPGVRVFAQTGNGEYRPRHMEWRKHLALPEFRALCSEAGFIVSHAGIGNVLLALELGKSLVILPRRAELKEHRNDHQMATARRLEGRSGITVVYDEKEIGPVLNGENSGGGVSAKFRPWASDELLCAISKFINEQA